MSVYNLWVLFSGFLFFHSFDFFFVILCNGSKYDLWCAQSIESVYNEILMIYHSCCFFPILPSGHFFGRSVKRNDLKIFHIVYHLNKLISRNTYNITHSYVYTSLFIFSFSRYLKAYKYMRMR